MNTSPNQNYRSQPKFEHWFVTLLKCSRFTGPNPNNTIKTINFETRLNNILFIKEIRQLLYCLHYI